MKDLQVDPERFKLLKDQVSCSQELVLRHISDWMTCSCEDHTRILHLSHLISTLYTISPTLHKTRCGRMLKSLENLTPLQLKIFKPFIQPFFRICTLKLLSMAMSFKRMLRIWWIQWSTSWIHVNCFQANLLDIAAWSFHLVPNGYTSDKSKIHTMSILALSIWSKLAMWHKHLCALV